MSAPLPDNGLVFLDSHVTPKPDLAETWTIAPDGKSYTFTLRQNVKWHDGKPFTSADVKFSFEDVLLRYHGRTATMRNLLDGIDAPDPQTVWPGIGRLIYDATLARDYPLLMGQFFVAALGVVLANLITDLTYAVLDPRVRLR